MEEITPDNLKTIVERVSKEQGFQIQSVFAAKDDYSLPEIKNVGLMQRPEILVACHFDNEIGEGRVSLEYRLFNEKFDSFIAKIVNFSFIHYPEVRQIIEGNLSKAGIKVYIPQQDKFRVIAQLDPSVKGIETFLSAYFKSQQQANKYIIEDIKNSP